MKMNYIIVACFSVFIFASSHAQTQRSANQVTIVGEMRNVMWKGQLQGTISLDTIASKKNLYGLGPIEYLAGEILVIDGRSYKSTVVSETGMKVEESYDLKAPFFGYANISNWTEHACPDSVQTIGQLEQFLDKMTIHAPRPFLFRIAGMVDNATIHIVNLPKGSKVGSPDDAHRGQVNYRITAEQVEIVGFFSTQHKAIFTHHDTFLHMHLITADRQRMGHLDEVVFQKGSVNLYLPAE